MGFFSAIEKADRAIEKGFGVKNYKCTDGHRSTSNTMGMGWRCKHEVKLYRDRKSQIVKCNKTCRQVR